LDHFTVEVVPGAPPPLSGLGEGLPWLDGNDNICARVYRDGATDWIDWTALGIFEISRRRPSIRVWPRDSTQAHTAVAHARERLQALLMQTRNCQVLHAAAVEIGGHAIAIAGASGSGKSTLAFALAQRGFDHIADDAVVVRRTDARLHVVPLPFRPQLRGASAALTDEPVRLIEHSAGTLPLGTVILLEKSETVAEPRSERLFGPTAWTALTAHAHVFDESDREARAEFVEAYAMLTSLIPVFRLTRPERFEALATLADDVERLCRSLVS
jgi:hypothetical protein